MELEILPVINLELLQLEGNMGDPYEYSFKMGDMRELFEAGLLEYCMLCYHVALYVPVYEYVFDVKDLVYHSVMRNAILAHIRVHIKRALKGPSTARSFTKDRLN